MKTPSSDFTETRLTVEGFEKSCKDFETEMVTSTGYHIYTDWTGYVYDITLVRSNLVANLNERHMLKVCLNDRNETSLVSL